jgi:hippurate hydrolase
MHACGHGMHVTWLVGAATIMAQARDSWRGTLVALFQPAEETGEGAQAMINDHLFSHFPKPDVILGQHVMSMPAGVLACRSGVITSAGDSFEIRMFGRGAHGSMPEASIDPVVMAASTVLRLQTIVSREIAAAESAVLTIGALQAGTKENVIPDEAILKINVRSRAVFRPMTDWFTSSAQQPCLWRGPSRDTQAHLWLDRTEIPGRLPVGCSPA